MALSEGDKAIVMEMVHSIVTEVTEKLIRTHIQTCPHGKSLMVSKALLIGCMIGSGLGAGGISALVVKLLMST